MKAQSTTLPKLAETAEKWYVVDADGQVVGRLAARVAKLVRGKMRADFSPSSDPRIFVVVINADRAVFTGNKMKQKTYYWHSGWRTGIKSRTAQEMFNEKPTEVLRTAIHGMLPKNRLGSQLNKHVKIYAGAEHPHGAQEPEVLTIVTRQPKERE